MKIFIATCAIALGIAVAPIAIPAPGAAEAPESVALEWLGLVDAGNYDRSWDTASSLFQRHVSKPQWQHAVASARAPFGNLKSRKLLSATDKNVLPGAPDGRYVVIQFASSFENNAAIETVTPMMDTDGQWHVSGFYIK